MDKKLRLGGFYELSIQVCPSKDMKPIEKYTDYLWKLDNVEGPFDIDFNKTTIDFENFENQGIINLDDKSIPFKTFNIRETEPTESGFNWFDISLYTAAIEQVFGQEYQTWTENPKSPELLDKFLQHLINSLYRIYPFKLAMIDFEISGQYYLEDLKDEFENWTSSIFFIGREYYKFVAEKNRRLVTVID
ncbi:MAG: hypothetical protein ACFB15_02965 [Cyclobacteriaceae bacterium]